jgi:hypothetical protein
MRTPRQANPSNFSTESPVESSARLSPDVRIPRRENGRRSAMSISLRELAFNKRAERPRAGVAPAYGRFSNRSLETVEPVSPPRNRKLEKSEQRPSPETRAQRTEMPQISYWRPAPTSLTRGNVDAFPAMAHTLKAPAQKFARAKAKAVAGLALGL